MSTESRSNPSRTDDETPIDELRTNRDAREGAESLAERDDDLGAGARIVLDLAEGRVPDDDDCEQIGLKTLPKLA